MGLMDKMKKILFDEEEVDVEPRKESRVKETVKESRSGFVDHGSRDEDTIKEVVVPKEEPKEVKMPEKEENAFGFTLDLENYEPVRETRSREPEVSEHFNRQYQSVPRERSSYNNHAYQNSTNYTREHQGVSAYNKYAVEKKQENKYQIKDYKKIINSPSLREKKPFSVTPVISPVYGIIDEEYIKENEVKFKEQKKETTNTEIFGPVSYIEDILPAKKKQEVIDNPKLTTDEIEVKEVVEEIVTPNYDDYEELQTSGIESKYIGNNIEDAFEPTSEYESVDFNVANDNITTEEKQENEALANTIETDLFNLIDSMYKDEEDE